MRVLLQTSRLLACASGEGSSIRSSWGGLVLLARLVVAWLRWGHALSVRNRSILSRIFWSYIRNISLVAWYRRSWLVWNYLRWIIWIVLVSSLYTAFILSIYCLANCPSHKLWITHHVAAILLVHPCRNLGDCLLISPAFSRFCQVASQVLVE